MSDHFKSKDMEPYSVDQYISSFSDSLQETLKELRRTIMINAPNAAESFSNGMLIYQIKNNALVSFSVKRNGIVISFHPAWPNDFRPEATDPGPNNNFIFYKAGQPVQYGLIGQIIRYWYKEYSRKIQI